MQLTSIQGSQKELLTVAFDGDFCPPSYIAKELDRNRNWELRLTAALPTQAQALLAAGEIDLWLGRTLCDAEQLNVVTMGTYRWAAVVPRWIIIDWFPEIWPETVEFFQNGINLQQFAAAPFLLPDRSSEIRKQIDAYLHYRYKFTPHVILESTQYEILVQRAWMGDGLTICPEPLVKGLFLDEEQKNAHIFPLNDDFWEDKLVIASHKDRPESPSVTSFIQKTRDTLKQTKLIY